MFITLPVRRKHFLEILLQYFKKCVFSDVCCRFKSPTTINPFATGHTPLCGWKPADSINVDILIVHVHIMNKYYCGCGILSRSPFSKEIYTPSRRVIGVKMLYSQRFTIHSLLSLTSIFIFSSNSEASASEFLEHNDETCSQYISGSTIRPHIRGLPAS